MEPVSALARIRAALRTGGVLALWWNVYRAAGVGDPFAEAVIPMLDAIPLPPSEGGGTHYSLDEAWHRELLETNGFEAVTYARFRRERTLDAEGIRALYSSYSFVRQLDPPAREALLDRIVTLVQREFGGHAPNVVLTPLYIATKRG